VPVKLSHLLAAPALRSLRTISALLPPCHAVCLRTRHAKPYTPNSRPAVAQRKPNPSSYIVVFLQKPTKKLLSLYYYYPAASVRLNARHQLTFKSCRYIEVQPHTRCLPRTTSRGPHTLSDAPIHRTPIGSLPAVEIPAEPSRLRTHRNVVRLTAGQHRPIVA